MSPPNVAGFNANLLRAASSSSLMNTGFNFAKKRGKAKGKTTIFPKEICSNLAEIKETFSANYFYKFDWYQCRTFEAWEIAIIFGIDERETPSLLG